MYQSVDRLLENSMVCPRRYCLNDIRTTEYGRDMEIWVPKTGSAPAPDHIEEVGARTTTNLSLPRACHGGRRISRPWLHGGRARLDGQVLRKLRQ